MAADTNWEALENALVAQVRAASGLAAGKVILEGQTLPSALAGAAVPGSGRPALPYVSLFRDAEDCLSFLPEVRMTDNPDGHPGDPAATPPVVGTELLVDYDVPAEFQVRLQAFTSEVRGNNAASALLSKVHAYFHTDASRDALRAVGLAVIEVGTVQNLTGLVETRMEGRAALDLRVRFVDGAQQALTYISSVEITPTIDGTPGTPFTVTVPEEG